MDFDFRLDLNEVMNVVESADVVALYFPLLRKTLLIDGRSSAVDGPMVKVVPMVSTPDERLRSLRQLRPRLPRPESITIIPWPKYVASLERLGVWERIVGRFVNAAAPDAVRQCEAAWQELLSLEREEVLRAVTGEDYKSLWEKSMPNRPDEQAGAGEGGSG
ncbi:MAG: hypothetical protein QME71_05825 [Dehalococcoidia bacterium]|nr:hypothetical protein [Dehalococcoidia bacterium]